MLTTPEVYLYSLVLFLLPLIVYSMVSGSAPPPPNTRLGKYYHAEKHLMLCGNLFVLSICATAAARVALHFGYIDPALTEQVNWTTHVPFMFLFFVYVAMWIRAALKLRRAEKPHV